MSGFIFFTTHLPLLFTNKISFNLLLFLKVKFYFYRFLKSSAIKYITKYYIYIHAVEGKRWQWQISWFWQQLSMQKGLANSLKTSVFNDHSSLLSVPRREQDLSGAACSSTLSQGRHSTVREMLLWEGLFGKERVLRMLGCSVTLHTDQPLLFHFSPEGPISAGSWASSSPPASRGLEGTSQMVTSTKLRGTFDKWWPEIQTCSQFFLPLLPPPFFLGKPCCMNLSAN